MRHKGSSAPVGFQPVPATIGSETRLATSSTMCRLVWVFGFRRLEKSE